MDSLQAELSTVKEDSAKLRIYLALSNASKGKDNLLYIAPAWKLLDKMFLKENIELNANVISKNITSGRPVNIFFIV